MTNGSLNGRRRVVITGLGSVTPLGNDVESTSAWRAAARIICANRSMRLACLCSIHSVGSKSFTSHAKWTA